MWLRFVGFMSWWNNFRSDNRKERDHQLNKARHKALYSKSGRVKPRQHDQRPPTPR